MKNIQAYIFGCIAVIIIGGIAYTAQQIMTEKVASIAETVTYKNLTYGYEVSYPNSIEAKEYIPEDIVFGQIENETVKGIVEIRVINIQGEADQTFEDALIRELSNLCAADGPHESFSCIGIESSIPFETRSGIKGNEIYLKGELRNLQTGETKEIEKGPYFAFMKGTGATGSQVIVVHAPLNQTKAEADISTIKNIAESLVFESRDVIGTNSGRYMDIESYIKNSISEISPVKETLGGTFYVTSIETHDGTGTVSYEDGHNTYIADFHYKIEEDGRPVISEFSIRNN